MVTPLPHESAFKMVSTTPLSRAPLAPMTCIMQTYCPAGLHCDYHAYEGWVLFHAMLVLSGRIIFQESGGKAHVCTPGTVIVCPFDRMMRWEVEQDTEILQCHHRGFTVNEHGVLGTFFGPMQKHLATIDAGPELAKLTERRLSAAHLSDFKDFKYSLAVYEFLGASLEAAQTLSQTANLEQGYSPLVRCLNYIEYNIHTKLTVAKLSRHSFVGVNRLSQLFRENLGVTPLQYVARRKVKVAERLLCEVGLGVGEVAERLGFNSINYFSRFFKQHTGRNPSSLNVRIVQKDQQSV